MAIIISLVKEVKAVRGLFFLGFVLLLISTLGTQLAPLLLQGLIDGPLTNFTKGFSEEYIVLVYGLLAYLGILFLTRFIAYVTNMILVHCSNQIATNLRNRAYSVMQNLPISYFDDKPAGKIATTIVNDTETLRQQFYVSLLSQTVVIVIQIMFIYGIIFTLNPSLALWLLLLVPIVYGWQLAYRRLVEHHITDYYEGRSKLNAMVNESINGIDILQLYHQEDRMIGDFNKTSNKMLKEWDKVIFYDSTISWEFAELLKYTVIAGLLTLVGLQFLGHESGTSAGYIFIYISYIMSLFDLLNWFVHQFSSMQQSISTGERLFHFLGEKTEQDENSELVVSEGVVSFEHVNFSYEEGKPVLKDITIRADKGETVALVGHTGSGKSSIMNLLYRFYDPQEGRILVDGQDISQFSRESVRQSMGIILQDPYLFTGTIATNVSMGNDVYTDEMIISTLERIGASPMLQRLPKGIHTEVTEKGNTFSSGERQLIAFARTLIVNPKILILDEATSHIDTETERIIQKAMEILKEGRTTFIIAHRLSTIQHANHILVLDKGHIVESGEHEELLAQNGIYTQMYKSQMKY